MFGQPALAMRETPPDGTAVGGPWMDAPLDVAAINDGGFIAAGVSDPHATGDADLHVMRFDAAGNLVWERRFGGRDFDYAAAAAQAGDGGFLAAGAVRQLNANRYDILLLKLDPAGGEVWERVYGGAREDVPAALLPLPDGGLALAANTSSHGSGKSDFWLLRLDKNGDVIWQRTYGGAQRDSASALVQTPDKGFIIAGTTESFGPGVDKIFSDPSYRFTKYSRPSNFYAAAVDENGNLIWERAYGGAHIADRDVSIAATKSGYALVGTTAWLPDGGPCDLGPRNRIRVIRIDRAGNTIWDNTYGAEDRDDTASGALMAADGLLITGTTKAYSNGDANAFAFLVDDSGKQIAANTCGGAAAEVAVDAAVVRSGGPVIAARTRSFGSGHWDAWFMPCPVAAPYVPPRR